mmetsp:Transcript_13083/g.30991  ORF Transcript_13083/g.30991 Transcript_13083/m.30991 type:complete len:216 (-) Transcript_13083:678-1325(-)
MPYHLATDHQILQFRYSRRLRNSRQNRLASCPGKIRICPPSQDAVSTSPFPSCASHRGPSEPPCCCRWQPSCPTRLRRCCRVLFHASPAWRLLCPSSEPWTCRPSPWAWRPCLPGASPNLAWICRSATPWTGNRPLKYRRSYDASWPRRTSYPASGPCPSWMLMMSRSSSSWSPRRPLAWRRSWEPLIAVLGHHRRPSICDYRPAPSFSGRRRRL